MHSSLKATVVIGAGAPKPSAEVPPQIQPQSLRKTGKETIRDFKELIAQESGAWRLVPLHGTDHPEVVLEEGNVVTIGEYRFRVVK